MRTLQESWVCMGMWQSIRYPLLQMFAGILFPCLWCQCSDARHSSSNLLFMMAPIYLELIHYDHVVQPPHNFPKHKMQTTQIYSRPQQLNNMGLHEKQCKVLGKTTPSRRLWLKFKPNIKLWRPLGNVTPSRLSSKCSPNVKLCRALGKVTPFRLWLKL